MKRLAIISSLLLALLCSCTQSKPAMPKPDAPLHSVLAALDTLMQTLPDSAFARLYAMSGGFDTLAPHDRHYADLLLAEALFKCDYEQATRPALLEALAYHDSLAAAYPASDDYTLLAARSHYMNGVGLYENDSIVEACQEYIKALETMEDHFDEKELTGYKAKFMALTYNRLGDLFASQYMMEQAIAFFQKSLVFCKICETTKYGISRTLLNIGQQFDMKGNADSADYYFNQSLLYLPDTNNIYYRDLVSAKALLAFFTQKDSGEAFSKLKTIIDATADDDEQLTRSMTIGSLYFYEKIYDSAVLYLNMVFNYSEDLQRRLLAASCLSSIYDSLGKEKEAEGYMHFLAQQAMPEYENRILLSALDDLFQQYLQQRHEKVLSNERKQSLGLIFFVSFIVVILTFIIIVGKRKAVKQNERNSKIMREKEMEHGLEMQEMQERHQASQNALSGRLRKSNEELRKQKEQTEILLKEKETWQKRGNWNSINDFIEEDICKEILELMQGKNVKREAKVKDNTELKLDKSQLLRLKTAAEKHFMGYEENLFGQCPKMTNDEFNQCLLYLLDLDDKQVAALLGFDYSTIKKRSAKMKKAFGTEKDLPFFIKKSVL